MTLGLFALIVAGLLVVMELQRRGFQTERDGWARTQAELLNRIKPETAQPLTMPEIPQMQALPLDGPTADDAYWQHLDEMTTS